MRFSYIYSNITSFLNYHLLREDESRFYPVLLAFAPCKICFRILALLLEPSISVIAHAQLSNTHRIQTHLFAPQG